MWSLIQAPTRLTYRFDHIVHLHDDVLAIIHVVVPILNGNQELMDALSFKAAHEGMAARGHVKHPAALRE